MRERLMTAWKSKKWMAAVILFMVQTAGFTLAGRLLKPEYIIHSRLDDLIPVCEYFIVPYLLWFVWMPGSLLFFLLYEPESYIKLCKIMFGGSIICVIFYFFFPNCVDFTRQIPDRNIFARVLNMLYATDPPTNAFPSIHVSSTTAIWAVILNSKLLKKSIRAQTLGAVMTISICLATLFIKQHSIWDAAAGAGLTLILTLIVYRKKKEALPYRS